MAGRRGGGNEKADIMSEDGRDNTAPAPAQAAGGRGAVADDASDAVDNTVKNRCKSRILGQNSPLLVGNPRLGALCARPYQGRGRRARPEAGAREGAGTDRLLAPGTRMGLVG